MNNKQDSMKNTNLEKIDQINIVTKYISSSFGRSNKIQLKGDVYTVILDKDKVTLNDQVVSSISDLVIPPNSLISFIFQKVGRSTLLDLVNTIFLKGAKGILVQPYSLALCMGLGIQHCIIVREYESYSDVYIIDEYVLHDTFTIYNTVCDNNEVCDNKVDIKVDNNKVDIKVDNDKVDNDYVVDYVEEFQKVRLTEDTLYFGCKVCDFKSKSLEVATDHLKVTHFFDKDTNMLYKYEITHGNDLVDELIKRLKFLYFNLDRLKRLSIRVISNYKDNELLIDQLKFIYNNAILIQVEESFVYKGNEIFNSLDISKECWVSDKEWRDLGLRVLKDRVLFNL